MKSLKGIKFLVLALMISFVLVGCNGGGDQDDDNDPTPPNEVNLLGEWTTSSSVYTINTNSATSLDFNYEKGEVEKAYLEKDASSIDWEVYNALKISVQGSGTIVLALSMSDNTEAVISLNVTGITGSYEWNLISVGANISKVVKVTISASDGKINTAGNVEISELTLTKAVANNYIIQTNFNNIPSNVNEYNGTDETFHINKLWENFDSEKLIYQFTYDEDDCNVEYVKEAGDEWACFLSRVRGTLSDFNFIVIKAQGEAGKRLLVKVEDTKVLEKQFLFDGTVQTFYLDISSMTAEEKNGIQKVILFASPNAIQNGEFVIKDAYFAEQGETTIIEKHTYNGTDETFSANEHWYDGGDLVYSIDKNGSIITMNYDKTANQSYSSAKSYLDGDFSGFRYVVLNVTGAANKTALFKVESELADAANVKYNVEVQVTFEGIPQNVVIDMSTLSNEAKAALETLLVFAAPGGAGNGTIVINSAIFTNTAPKATKSVFTGQFEFDINDYYVSNDEGVYSFDKDEVTGKVTVNYAKGAGFAWSFMQTFMSGDTTGFDYIELVIKGTDGETLLVKPNDDGTLEQTFTFDGTEQTVVVPVAGAAAINKILFFVAPNSEVSGSFEIISALFKHAATDGNGAGSPLDVNQYWYSNDVGMYDFVKADDAVTVSANTTLNWTYFKTLMTNVSPSLNYLVMQIKGSAALAGKQVIIKPNDDGAMEKSIILTTEPQLVVIQNTTANPFSNILVFVDPNGNVTGDLVIESAYLATAAPFTSDIMSGAWQAWEANDKHVVSNVENEVSIAYSRGGYDFVYQSIVGISDSYNALVFVAKGEVGHEYIIKVEGGGTSKETKFIGTGDYQTVTMMLNEFTAAQKAGFTMIDIFCGVNDELNTGTLLIQSEVLKAMKIIVSTGPKVYAWEASSTAYQISEDGGIVTVNHDGVNINSWDHVKKTVEGLPEGTITVKFTFTGTSGLEYLFKVESNVGADNVEKSIVATGSEQTIELSVSGKTLASYKLLVIFARNTGAGTLVISNVEYLS